MNKKNIKTEEDLDIEIIDVFEGDSLKQSVNSQPMPSKSTQTSPQPMPNKPTQTSPQPIPNRESTPQKPQNVSGDTQSESIVKGDKKIKKSWFSKIFLILIISVIAVFSAFYLYKSNPKRLLVKGIAELAANFEHLSKPIKNTFVNIDGNKNISGNINLNLQLNIDEEVKIDDVPLDYQKIVENINNTNFKYNYQKDLTNNNILFGLLGNLNGNDLFNVKFLNVENKQYVFLKDIFEKYIELGNVEAVSNVDVNTNIGDIKYLWEIVTKSLNKNIKESYIKSERIKINLNQKEVNTKKTTLNLTKQNQKELFKNLILDLKNDEQAVKILSKYNSEFANKDINEIIEKLEIEKNFAFSIYYKDITNKIVMMELVDEVDNNKIVYTKGNEDTVEIITNNEVIYRATFKIEEEKFIINAKTKEDSIITINGKQNKDDYTYTWNLISGDYTVTGNYILKQVTVTNNQEYNTNRDFNVKVAQKGKEILSLNVIDNAKITNDVQINDKFDGAVKISDLTEEETSQIIMGLFSNVMGILER